ncbi:sodium-coupled monocarboxylate transporter 1 [Asbolus verrucosus]|uniref:Sodium-coupled monocarboxylate transporter 1 n=1 Tax=Asbolus verrucosus TaxID=1661398 RepID=A0A482V9R7_ASBVE|nr:sodium-coupled monocarboxylate transporter 1 [Asbolus verrucosus]
MKKIVYRFGVVDYVVFGGMLLLSALTGVYIAWRNRAKRNEPDRLKDYLTGNKKLKSFPVAMSLIASYISGITMIGTPAEIYNFGTQYWMVIFAMCFSGLIVATVYLPVFTTLEVCSSYEYLEIRFHKVLRSIASFFFLFDEGGLKAVVYTDTWQTIVMFISLMVVVVVGIVDLGGFATIVHRAYEGERMQPLNPSMYERYTIFSVLIGGCTYWTSFNAVNQTMVQRYLSLPTIKKAKFSISIFTVGVVFFISLCCFAGILMYATYYKCDPLAAQRITTDDQLLPLYVMETAGHLHGIPGLFIAGVFGAALRFSLSVVLNSTAIVLLEDFFRGLCHIDLSERIATIIAKVIITTLGVAAVALVFVIELIGAGVFEVATTLSAIAAGTMFGVFSLGMLIPWANTKGAIAGAVGGFLMSGITAYGRQAMIAQKYVVAHELPVSIEKCEEIYGIKNLTLPEVIYPDESNVFPLFRLSYLWVTPIGVASTMIVGIIVSFLTGKTDIRYLDPELISPISQWMLPKEAQNYAGTAIKKVKHQRLLGSDQGLLPSQPVDLNDMRDQERSDDR